jgi:hypothetical protein
MIDLFEHGLYPQLWDIKNMEHGGEQELFFTALYAAKVW